MYQNQKVQFYSREKRFIEDHIVQIVERVVSCFEKRYGNLYSNLGETSINISSDDGDHIIFDVCRILNCNVWPNVTDDSDTATQYSLQLAALITVFNRYKDIAVIKCYTQDISLVVSLMSFVMHTDTLILLSLTQSIFGQDSCR